MTDIIPEEEHKSMLLYRILETRLISSGTALEIARLVLEDNFPENALLQMPLSVDDGGDIWIVLGSQPEKTGAANSDSSIRNKLKVHISKFNGRILRLTS